METRFKVLSHLQENDSTSQRRISQQTGLSLGCVNLLLKKMIHKNIIIEHLRKHKISYTCYSDAASITEPAGNNRLVLIWRPEEESLNKTHRAVNVLNML